MGSSRYYSSSLYSAMERQTNNYFTKAVFLKLLVSTGATSASSDDSGSLLESEVGCCLSQLRHISHHSFLRSFHSGFQWKHHIGQLVESLCQEEIVFQGHISGHIGTLGGFLLPPDHLCIISSLHTSVGVTILAIKSCKEPFLVLGLGPTGVICSAEFPFARIEEDSTSLNRGLPPPHCQMRQLFWRAPELLQMIIEPTRTF